MHEPAVEDVESISVVGAGSTGHGIAQVFAASGYRVSLIDIAEEPLQTAMDRIESSLHRIGEDPAWF